MKTLQKEAYQFKVHQRESAVECVIKNLKELLLTRQLKPGDRLPNEHKLAQMMGVSRGSVREAMKILQTFGFIDVRQGDGTYITEPSTKSWFEPLLFELILTEASVQEFMEFRETLEAGILKLAIRNASENELQELVSVHTKLEEAVQTGMTDPQKLTALDIAFHLTLGSATKNVLLEKIYRFVLDFFAPTIEKTYERERTGQNALRLHRNILTSVLERDWDKALASLRESIEEWKRLFSGE
jgi:GntR family transcriptional repressor for pyruvate dehydrogenase complex